jgi:hypothetical protein
VNALHARCQHWSDQCGRAIVIHLFTTNPTARRLYEHTGFCFVRVVQDSDGDSMDLFRQEFLPTSAAPAAALAAVP